MNYWEWTLEPVQMSDELYYVGTTKGPSHLLKTDDGLVLIDSGWPQSLYMLLMNIQKLGFDYRDIKHIIHTHGHIDHFGGTRALVELTGAKTYIGMGDEDAVMGKNGLDCSSDVGLPLEGSFVPDYVIKDGKKLNFGNTEISFLSTPGHTKGTLSLFFDVSDRGEKYKAGMFGGAGLNTLKKDYIEKHGLSYSCRQDYLESLAKLLPIQVDFHLGNHVKDNNHLEKMIRVKEEKNPFLDPTSWTRFLNSKKAEVETLILKENN